MLTHLYIRNYALIDRLELEFAEGFTVLSGETGAGKSILIEALSLALGDRADSGVILQGADRAEIVATIDVQENPSARRWLSEQELDNGHECLLRRTISADGRSKAYINGSMTPLTSLRALGALLIDIHGQHEHHSLLGREHQRDLLDGFAEHPELTAEVSRCHGTWKQLTREIRDLESHSAGAGGQVELLRYQAGELDGLNLAEEELQQLGDEHKRLSSAGQLRDACRTGLAALEDDEEALSGRIAQLAALLRQCSEADAGLKTTIELLDSAAIQLDEAAIELRNYSERLDLDPQRLVQVERRLTAIHDIARKHRVRPADLPALQQQLHASLKSLESGEARLRELREALGDVERAYQKAAQALTKSRSTAARRLEKDVTREMRRLGMPEGRFSIDLEPQTDDRLSASGLERALFLVSANPQQAPKPLAKVASGGELSRIGLAIQMITAEQNSVPTVIFDEVDVGIGGRIAEIVGQGLRRLGARRQVLCITHLPQVAALGHHHLQVAKTTAKTGAVISIRPLTRKQRSEEIARMLGGIEISAKTRAHAEELIKRSEECAEP